MQLSDLAVWALIETELRCFPLGTMWSPQAASLAIETLEEAYAAQWRVLVRCNGHGRIDGPSSR
jgi:hypothetical protein